MKKIDDVYQEIIRKQIIANFKLNIATMKPILFAVYLPPKSKYTKSDSKNIVSL